MNTTLNAGRIASPPGGPQTSRLTGSGKFALPVDYEGYNSYRLNMDQITALTTRRHVDLRRQASAICTRGVRAGERPAGR
jgi:hypothetical protein